MSYIVDRTTQHLLYMYACCNLWPPSGWGLQYTYGEMASLAGRGNRPGLQAHTDANGDGARLDRYMPLPGPERFRRTQPQRNGVSPCCRKITVSIPALLLITYICSESLEGNQVNHGVEKK